MIFAQLVAKLYYCYLIWSFELVNVYLSILLNLILFLWKTDSMDNCQDWAAWTTLTSPSARFLRSSFFFACSESIRAWIWAKLSRVRGLKIGLSSSELPEVSTLILWTETRISLQLYKSIEVGEWMGAKCEFYVPNFLVWCCSFYTRVVNETIIAYCGKIFCYRMEKLHICILCWFSEQENLSISIL